MAGVNKGMKEEIQLVDRWIDRSVGRSSVNHLVFRNV